MSQVAARVQPAVVTVEATLFRDGGTSDGAGFLIDQQGDILTNAHVVLHAVSLNITDAQGQSHSASLIGLDQSRDLAELRVSDLRGRMPLSFQTRAPAVGADIVVVGNPFGKLPETVTKGIVSGANRSASVGGTAYSGLIQIDAVVNPGNSGGPVMDMTGKVIGVLTLGSSAARFGFAIPSAEVVSSARSWATEGTVIDLGPPLVAADAKTLVLQASETPAGYAIKSTALWSNLPKSWVVVYYRAPGYLVNGSYITSYVQITSSASEAQRSMSGLTNNLTSEGYMNQGLTGHLGDETLTYARHEGSTDHFDVVWRDRNVVALLTLDVIAGDANLGSAAQLASLQETHIDADLRMSGFL